nr:MAG TPA: anti-TRAP protein [Caudoviricetes sp.]
MDDLNKIITNARVLSWKRGFGPFVKCPECLGLLAKCDLCKGKGKLIQEDIDAWNNPIARMKRERKHG